MSWTPCPVNPVPGKVPSLGHPDVDDYLQFVAARARPNKLLATAFDLKVFFTVVGKEPAAVNSRDVLGFLKSQRAPPWVPQLVGCRGGCRACWGQGFVGVGRMTRVPTRVRGPWVGIAAVQRGVAAPIRGGVATWQAR